MVKGAISMGDAPPADGFPLFFPPRMYHCAIQVISRSKGRSAVAAAAYRSGDTITSQRDGRTHDYSRRSGVEASFLVGWGSTRAELWNQAEAVEKRKDSSLAREIRVALPGKSQEFERELMVKNYCEEIRKKYGMACDASIHTPDKHGDQRNYHAHILLTVRQVDESGTFAKKKDRSWGGPEGRKRIEELRELWAQTWNSYATFGDYEQVDHRSYQRQGIDRTPTQHDGPRISGARRRGYLPSRAPAVEPQDRQISLDELEREIAKTRTEYICALRERGGPTIKKENHERRNELRADSERSADEQPATGRDRNPQTAKRTASGRSPASRWRQVAGGIPRGGIMGPRVGRPSRLSEMDAHADPTQLHPGGGRGPQWRFGDKWASGATLRLSVWRIWRTIEDTFRGFCGGRRSSDSHTRRGIDPSPTLSASTPIFSPEKPPPVEDFPHFPEIDDDSGPSWSR